MWQNKAVKLTYARSGGLPPGLAAASEKERKKVMHDSIRLLSRNRDIRSPSQRVALRVASVYVKKIAVEGRRGPAPGSVLEHDIAGHRTRERVCAGHD